MKFFLPYYICTFHDQSWPRSLSIRILGSAEINPLTLPSHNQSNHDESGHFVLKLYAGYRSPPLTQYASSSSLPSTTSTHAPPPPWENVFDDKSYVKVTFCPAGLIANNAKSFRCCQGSNLATGRFVHTMPSFWPESIVSRSQRRHQQARVAIFYASGCTAAPCSEYCTAMNLSST